MNVQNLSRATLALAAGALILTSSAVAQDMPMPKPGPEHKIFEMDAGTWDATVETFMPGAPPMTSPGTETNTIGCGGLCLISDFKSVMAGAPYHGHGTSAWDPAKKKYVGTWTDSMSAGISMGESTYDPATKTMTGWMEGPDMTGHVSKMKNVSEQKDPDTRVFTMFMPGADGKDVPGMRITYKRRK
jgi:hypothetical protein